MNVNKTKFSSSNSTTVADPSTVTVRIESASASDLNVQDVSTSSSNDDEEDEAFKGRRTRQTLNYRPSSAASSRHVSPVDPHRARTSLHRQRPNHLNTEMSAMRVSPTRPITAVSLPAKPSAYDNEWAIDSEQIAEAFPQQRPNPPFPSTSPIAVRTKSTSATPPTIQPKYSPQQAPPVFITTSECLGNCQNKLTRDLFSPFDYFPLGTDFRSTLRRDLQRRSQSLGKPNISTVDAASPTAPLVFLTEDILLGSIRALQNERQLCKLSVEYLIDASNMRPDELARKANVGAPLPCHCGHTHSRCTLTLEFDQPHLPTASSMSDSNHLSNSKIRELSRTQLGQLFSAVNRFIFKGQQEGKRILIYGFELTQNSPLAVIAIQYLMLTDEQINLAEATQTVHRLLPVLPIKHQQFPVMDKRFQEYLKQLDRKTFPTNFVIRTASGDGGSSSSGNEHPRSSKDISSDLLEMTTNNSSTSLRSWTTSPMPIINDNSNQLFAARSAWDS